MRLTLYSYVATALLAGQALLAQHVHPMSAGAAGPGGLPVTVDGAKTPQGIPDALAYSHFFTAIAAHPSPTPQEQGRQNAQLTPLELAAGDLRALTGLLANFRVQLDQIESAIITATLASQVEGLRAQKSALVSTTLTNLQQTLTPAAVARIDQYVQTRVKTHIVIYGSTM